MKYKTLFRILLKVVGVYCCVSGIASLASRGEPLIRFTVAGAGTLPWLLILSELVYGFVYAAMGLYLFFGGEWIVNKAIPSNRPYCHECGYDLTAATQNRCPECGTPYKNEDVQPPKGIESKTGGPSL